MAGPHRRLAEEHDVLGAELHRLVRAAEELESLHPITAAQRLASRLERILDDLRHVLTVDRILEVCHAEPPA